MPQTTQITQITSAIEQKLLQLIAGDHLGDITQELCDFSLEEQNATAEAQGVQPTASSDFIPVLGKSVTYIVAAVLINDNDEILMMQEAKPSCSGKWYLPAGRMEKGESISEAAIREIFEETGLNAEITTLLAIEAAGGSWFRFVLTGRITGGTLKTLDQADKESLQAKWVGNLTELPLRANDILNIIEIGQRHRQRNVTQHLWHPEVLPTRFAHQKNYLRVLAVIRKRATNTTNILVSEKNVHHFPTVEVHPQRSLHSTLRKFMIELFGAELPQHRPHGILSVEHAPLPATASQTRDGICLNVLVVFRPPLEEVSLIGKCVWHELSKPLDEKLGRMLSSKYSTVPLNVIR